MIDLSHLLWPGAGLGFTSAVSQGWLLFTLLLWLLALLYSLSSLQQDPRAGRYWLFMLLCFAGNVLLIAAQDALSFYLGFSMMSLAGTGLVLHSGTKQARRAGRLYLQLAVVGELLLFSALVLRASAAGGLYDWQSWQNVPLDHLTISLFVLGLGLKAGFFPLHLWLPQAHPVAPAAASAVLSGAMIKAGIFGMWLFLPATDPLLQQWGQGVLWLGFVSAIFGALAALCQQKSKQILAYSSVSQMGYLLMLLSLSWLLPPAQQSLALIALVGYAAHHAFAKGALFLLAGSASRYRFGTGDQLLLGFFIVSLAALPLPAANLLYLGALCTALALCHLLMRLKAEQLALLSQTSASNMPWLQRGPVLLLAVAAVLLSWSGVMPASASVWLPLGITSYTSLSLQALTAAAIWAAIWPVLMALPTYYLLQRFAGSWLLQLGRRQRWVFFTSLKLKRLYQPL
ncbi:MAG: proton-conducting transporter membrane subunit [Alishewanella agri]|nr:proton-conducting transporter membrane subunit [Alishewanella agri]